MKEVQKHQLDMLIELDRICKKYNIKYFISSGTLLGAVRHKGFIPWDDDADVDMLRSDYNKFLKVAQKELGDKYFLQTIETDENYGYMFAKIRENNTVFLEKLTKDIDINNGIFIDVFPIDNYKKSFSAALLMNHTIFLRLILLEKKKYYLRDKSLIRNLGVDILKIIALFFSKEKVFEKIKKNQIKYNNIKTEYVADWNCMNIFKRVLKKDIYKKRKLYDFENIKLYGHKDYDTYLKYYYNDYMTPTPPKGDENGHDIIAIEINEN